VAGQQHDAVQSQRPERVVDLGQSSVSVGQRQARKTANGGTTPTSASAPTAATAKLHHAQCVAAKSLNIRVNPQFGRLDYTDYQIVSASSTAPPTPGPTTTASASGLIPAC
jgi:hypothetical protein